MQATRWVRTPIRNCVHGPICNVHKTSDLPCGRRRTLWQKYRKTQELHILHADTNHVTWKSGPPPSRAYSAPAVHPHSKRWSCKTSPKVPLLFLLPSKMIKENEKRSSKSSRLANLYDSPSDSKYDTHSALKRSRMVNVLKEDEHKVLHPVINGLCDELDYQNYRLPLSFANISSKYDDLVAKEWCYMCIKTTTTNEGKHFWLILNQNKS